MGEDWDHMLAIFADHGGYGPTFVWKVYDLAFSILFFRQIDFRPVILSW
jgi:hypothetical protein